MVRHGGRVGTGRGEGFVGGPGGGVLGRGADGLRLIGRQDGAADEGPLERVDGIVGQFPGQLVGGAVLGLGVGRRMGVRTGDAGVDETGPLAGAHPGHRPGAHRAAGGVVPSVHLRHGQSPEAADQFRDRGRGLIGRSDRDGVAVVGHHVEHGKVEPAGRVQALPELPLRRRPLAERHVGQFVTVRATARQPWSSRQIPARLGTAHGGQALAARRRGLGDDVPGDVAPVARHLAATGGRILRRSHRLEEDVTWRHAQGEDEGTVAVVGEEPVVGGSQRPGQGGEEDLVAGPRDLEEHPALLLQEDLPVVEGARQTGQAEVLDELVDGKGVQRPAGDATAVGSPGAGPGARRRGFDDGPRPCGPCPGGVRPGGVRPGGFVHRFPTLPLPPVGGGPHPLTDGGRTPPCVSAIPVGVTPHRYAQIA